MSKLRIAPRGMPRQPDPPKVAALPDVAGDDEMYTAVSMWLDRIAHDLGEMECRRYPASESGR